MSDRSGELKQARDYGNGYRAGYLTALKNAHEIASGSLQFASACNLNYHAALRDTVSSLQSMIDKLGDEIAAADSAAGAGG